VPAAFLLAILTQESNLGKNVGTCNRPGDPPEKSWKVVMKPTRDQEPFKTITSELGRDPDITPVSCPMKNKDGSQMGWGGAMGPAQFIPSTWMGYRARVAAITGKAADPWDIRDAFVAAALLLKSNGADETRDGQWKAAMRYFSGGTNTRYRFYGDNVLATTAKYEQDIKDLKQ
jgi:membrane-bound lytic murein transglycosylase B